jgi:hypothetical protein
MIGAVFRPFGNELVASVYAWLPRRSSAGVHELVRHADRHHHDLAVTRLDDILSGRERNAALLHHEDLLVGMLMQLRVASRQRVNQDEQILVSS